LIPEGGDLREDIPEVSGVHHDIRMFSHASISVEGYTKTGSFHHPYIVGAIAHSNAFTMPIAKLTGDVNQEI
jgi:hypothetical protein